VWAFRPQATVFVELFNSRVNEEIFQSALHRGFPESIKGLHKDLAERHWHYNYERPRQGYSNVVRHSLGTTNKQTVIRKNLKCNIL